MILILTTNKNNIKMNHIIEESLNKSQSYQEYRDLVKQLVAKMPCVSIVHRVPEVALDLVGVDNTDGISRLMDHLHGLGHRRIGFFARCGDATWSRALFGSYADSLCRLGLGFESESVCDVRVEVLEDKGCMLDEQVDYVAERIRQ